MGKTFEEHLKYLEEVFCRLMDAKLKLDPKKCELLKKQVRYLGHIVSAEGVKTDPEKINVVKKWSIPKDQRKVSVRSR